MELIEAIHIENSKRVRARPVALPGEHGGWSLLAEPIAVGLLLAPSISGALLSLAAVAAFLARHPLRLAIGDLRRGRNTERTRLAKRFTFLYASIALLTFVGALVTANGSFLLPLVIATPFASIQFIYDAKGRSRALLPELAGATGIASVVAAIALAAGLSYSAAFALWAILIARVIPTILYLRVRLHRLRGKTASSFAPLAFHVAAVLIGVILAVSGTGSMLAVAALGLLLVRAISGLLNRDMNVRAKTLGVRELIFGVAFVILVSVGGAFGL
jgi:YwiC-like protein